MVTRHGMSETDKQLVLEMLEAFDKLSLKYDFEYSLFSASLLGHFRHDGFIPWHDGIDIIMRESDINKIQEAVAKDPRWTLKSHSHYYKFFSPIKYVSKPMKDWTWPFIDISVFRVNEKGTIVTVDLPDRFNFQVNANFMLPFTRKVFNNKFELSMPRNMENTLATLYGKGIFFICNTPFYNHKREMYVEANRFEVSMVPCGDLFDLFHFSPSYIERYSSLNSLILDYEQLLDKSART